MLHARREKDAATTTAVNASGMNAAKTSPPRNCFSVSGFVPPEKTSPTLYVFVASMRSVHAHDEIAIAIAATAAAPANANDAPVACTR